MNAKMEACPEKMKTNQEKIDQDWKTKKATVLLHPSYGIRGDSPHPE
jgi:hypothetical protein